MSESLSKGLVGLEKTSHRGVYKVDAEKPGEYITAGEMTVLPECSGDGGYGGPGEYKKYPEMEVVEYSMEKDTGLKEVGRIKVDEVDFTKPSSDSQPVPIKNTVGSGKPRKKASCVTPVETAKPVKTKDVVYKGSFGEMTVPYEHAFISGNAMVLVNSAFNYNPPENEEGFTVELDGADYRVYNINIKFGLPDYTKKITILLVED